MTYRTRFNKQLSNILQIEEGFSSIPYLCSEGFPTIGIGTKIGPKNANIEDYQFNVDLVIAEQWLQLKLQTINAQMYAENYELVRNALHECNAPRRAVVVSMLYQMGLNGVSKFRKSLNAISTRRFDDAATEMIDSKWAKQTPERAQRHAEQMKTGVWLDYYYPKHTANLFDRSDVDFCVLDTETTGLSNNDQVIEMGVIDQYGETLLNSLIQTNTDISEGAYETHKITAKELADKGLSFTDVFQSLCDITKDKNVIIFNSDFDLRLIKQTCKQHNCDFKDFQPKAVFCAMNDYSDYWGEWDSVKESYRWQSLKNAAAQQGVKYENGHRAVADCQITLALCKAVWGYDSCDQCGGQGYNIEDDYGRRFECDSCQGSGFRQYHD